MLLLFEFLLSRAVFFYPLKHPTKGKYIWWNEEVLLKIVCLVVVHTLLNGTTHLVLLDEILQRKRRFAQFWESVLDFHLIIPRYLVLYKSRWIGPAMWVQDISCKPDNLGSIWYVVFPQYFLVSEYLGTILYIFWCTNITHLLITCQWNYKKTAIHEQTTTQLAASFNSPKVRIQENEIDRLFFLVMNLNFQRLFWICNF